MKKLKLKFKWSPRWRLHDAYAYRFGWGRMGIEFEPHYGMGVNIWVWPDLAGVGIHLVWPTIFLEVDRV